MKRLLITGFDPFGGQHVNPSWAAVERLPEQVGDYVLCKLPVPTVFGAAAEEILQRAAVWQPDVVLCVGLAGGRDAVTPERIAINVRSASMPDNRGFQPVEEPVIPGGPDGLFSTVPVWAMAQAIREAGYPGRVSNTAGTYVCNDVLYTLLYRFSGTAVRAGFLHVPYLPQQGEPSMPLEHMAGALEAAILALDSCGSSQ